MKRGDNGGVNGEKVEERREEIKYREFIYDNNLLVLKYWILGIHLEIHKFDSDPILETYTEYHKSQRLVSMQNG